MDFPGNSLVSRGGSRAISPVLARVLPAAGIFVARLPGNNVHPDDRKHIRDRLNISVATGTDFHERYRDIALKDRPRRLAAFGKPALDPRHAVSHLMGVFINLTGQTKAAEALELGDKRFDAVTESTPDIAWSADSGGWHEFTGMAPDEIGPKTWTCRCPP